MEKLNEVLSHAKAIIADEEILKQKIEKGEPTKSTTARIRKSMNELKKVVTPAKEELLDFDRK